MVAVLQIHAVPQYPVQALQQTGARGGVQPLIGDAAGPGGFLLVLAEKWAHLLAQAADLGGVDPR